MLAMRLALEVSEITAALVAIAHLALACLTLSASLCGPAMGIVKRAFKNRVAFQQHQKLQAALADVVSVFFASHHRDAAR